MSKASANQESRSGRDIYFDQVIEAAYLHTKPGCFYIGPFARRVSFSSQQHRALDLVAALADRGKLRHRDVNRPKTVAVIGAGIAGITAMSALRGQGCTVHLYEARERPLMLQELAEHRLIHPNISRWPAVRLELTTEFAFLDWYAGTSDRVIASFRSEWDRWLKPRSGDKECLFLPEVRIEDLACEGGVVRLTRVAKDPNLALPENRYDYAFITTGFAEEDKFSGANFVSYWNWTHDEIEKWRADKRKVYISGSGDGGMIDALRLVHAEFDRGWLTVRLAQMLHGWRTEEILDAENDALMAAKSIACMNLSGDKTADKVGSADRKVGAKFEDERIVRQLQQFYSSLVEDLPDPAANLLNRSLEAANVEFGRVTLVSRQSGPFGPYAAPIHKIMVAHALSRSKLRFRQGALKGPKSALHFRWSDDGGGKTDIRKEDGVVIRHGSPANLKGLASEFESESLRIRQFMIADYIDPGLERSLPPPPRYPSRDRERARFIGTRLEMVRALVDSIAPGARVDADLSGYIYLPATIDPTDRAPIRVEMPSRVFGLKLVPGESKALEALL